jgi:hypothetical protein
MRPSQEVKELMCGPDHKKFMNHWQHRFRIYPDNTTDRSSVSWLARYCLNGGSSARCAQEAQYIFDSILPFSYGHFERAGYAERAASWRKDWRPLE